MSPEHEISLIMCKLHKLSTVQFVCTEDNKRLYEANTCATNTPPIYLHAYIIYIQRHKYTYKILCLCVSPYSKPDTQLYVDPHVQLQDNPAYETAGTTTANVVNREEVYETYQ